MNHVPTSSSPLSKDTWDDDEGYVEDAKCQNKCHSTSSILIHQNGTSPLNKNIHGFCQFCSMTHHEAVLLARTLERRNPFLFVPIRLSIKPLLDDSDGVFRLARDALLYDDFTPDFMEVSPEIKLVYNIYYTYVFLFRDFKLLC